MAAVEQAVMMTTSQKGGAARRTGNGGTGSAAEALTGEDITPPWPGW